MLLMVVTLLSAVGLTNGHICCMIRTFDAVQYFQQAMVIGGVQQVTEGTAMLSLDGDRQMMNSYVTSTTDGNTTSVRVLEDYKGKTRYTVTGDGAHCDKSPITTNWTDSCVPDGSPKSPPMFYGTSPSEFEVDIYTVPNKKIPGVLVQTTVSRADCTMMAESMKGSMGGVPFVVNTAMYNVTAGTRDPSVFKIPPSCSSETKVINRDVHSEVSSASSTPIWMNGVLERGHKKLVFVVLIVLYWTRM